MAIEKSVVIIGAGIAGLKAASDLYAKNCHSCVVLESRDRIGGRLHTVEGYDGRKYDLGASWHHDTLLNGLFFEELQLPEQERTPFVFDDDDLILFTENGKRLDHDPKLILEVLKEELDRFIELQFFESLDVKDISYFQIILKYLYQRRDFLSDEQLKHLPQLARYLELWHGIDWKTLSGKYAHIDHQGRNAMVLHYSSIVKRVASSFPKEWLKLSTEVCEVRREGKKVYVKTFEETYVCDYVIVTVPQSILELSLHKEARTGRIEFCPPLNEDIVESFGKVHYGTLGKVVFEFDKCCWSTERAKILSMGKTPEEFARKVRNATDFCALVKELDKDTSYELGNDPWDFPLYFVNLAKTTGVPSFVMLMQEPLTGYVESLEDKRHVYEYFKPILESLFKALGSDAPVCDFENGIDDARENVPILKNVFTTNWTREPYSLGAYSACFPGDDPMDFILALEKGQDSRIRFAGEHTVMDGAGCVYGAWESGKREASYISEKL